MIIKGDAKTRALAIFDRWYAAHEARDTKALAAALAEDAQIHSLFRREPVLGRAAAVTHFLSVNATFSDLAMSLTCVPAPYADRVLVEVEFSGAFTGELTWNEESKHGAGQRFCVPGVAIVRTGQDAVRSVSTFFNRDDWLMQIGFDAGTRSTTVRS